MAEDGEVGFDVEETFEETLEDADAEIHELKGILTEALGDMPFKVAIGFIVIFDFLYTSYGVGVRLRGKSVAGIDHVRTCHATIGPPKISPPGLVKAALYGPPGPLETLQLVPPGQPRAPRLVPLCYKWSPTLNMIQARQATRPDQFLRTACF